MKEYWYYLREIDKFGQQGNFSPVPNGKVTYYDTPLCLILEKLAKEHSTSTKNILLQEIRPTFEVINH